jgi:hypothetical protein
VAQEMFIDGASKGSGSSGDYRYAILQQFHGANLRVICCGLSPLRKWGTYNADAPPRQCSRQSPFASLTASS